MPNLNAAKKSLRQDAKRIKVNFAAKRELKGLIKDFKQAAEVDQKKAQEILPKVFKKLDKSAKINLIKKNKANRIKSRLSKKIALKK